MGSIFIESKAVQGVTIFDHLYLVYQNDDGSEFVLRAGPSSDNPLNYGSLVAELGVAMSDSEDFRPVEDRESHGNRILDLGERDADAVWNTLLEHASNIQDTAFSYTATGQNSNSFVASLLHAIGLDVFNNIPDADGVDWVPAADNNLDTVGFDLIGGVGDFADHSDLLAGGQSGDTLVGGGGSDTLQGNDGDDLLISTKLVSGSWDPSDEYTEMDDVADYLYGGNGNDTYWISKTSNVSATVNESISGAFNYSILDKVDHVIDGDGVGKIIGDGDGVPTKIIGDRDLVFIEENSETALQVFYTPTENEEEDFSGYYIFIFDKDPTNDVTTDLSAAFASGEYYWVDFVIDDFQSGDFGITLS